MRKQAVLHLVSRSVISPLNEELNREALRFSVKVSDSITDFVGKSRGIVLELADKLL